ncbi:MAG: S8 family serine peptidase [Candidatus Zixiibacteriota bacterium]
MKWLSVGLLGVVGLSGLSIPCRAVAGQVSGSESLPLYYMYEGAPIELTVDPNRVAIQFSPNYKARSQSAALSAAGLDLAETIETGVSGRVLVGSADVMVDAVEVNRRLELALQDPTVEFVSPVFTQANGGWMLVTPEILVRVKSEYRKDGVAILGAAAGSAEIVEENFGEITGAYKLRSQSKNGFEVLALANSLAVDPRIEWAEPDMMATVQKHLTPNDPGWPNLWGLNNTGQSGGTVDMDMDCDLAWDVTTGSPSIMVLVLDDGAELSHPDLNVGGGADFTGSGTSGGPGNSCDNHGTAVSGCVAAIINNSLGTIGAAPGCRVLTAKFTISNVPCDGSGTFQYSWLVSALTWGQSQGARVSNNSNGFAPSSSVSTKYQDTYNAGMVHFAAAGNEGTGTIGYPGSLTVVNAISAINRTGNKASFSNYGTEVSLAAPGQTIYTTDRTGVAGYFSGDYGYVDGTSFSAPYAAGVAALLLSVDPLLTAPEVETQLHNTATDLGTPGFDNIYGYGLVNAYSAVAYAQLDIIADIDLGPAPMTVNFTGTSARPVTAWDWDFGDGGTSTEQNPTHEYLDPGFYTVATTIETSGQFYTKTVDGMISVYADTIVIGDGQFDGANGYVEISARNYLPLSQIEIPFTYSGPLNIIFDSISITGYRTSFLTKSVASISPSTKTATVLIRAQTEPYLPPGEGPIAALWFHRSGSAAGTTPISFTSYLSYALGFTTYAGEYVPVSYNGSITATCCQGIVGDANGDLAYEPTIGDITMLISHLFITGVPLDCYLEADANQSGGLTATSEDITIGDVTVLVDYLFVTGTAIPECL